MVEDIVPDDSLGADEVKAKLGGREIEHAEPGDFLADSVL
jgi:hypothetical protein